MALNLQNAGNTLQQLMSLHYSKHVMYITISLITFLYVAPGSSFKP